MEYDSICLELSMGTNYYLHYPSETRCNHCGHDPNDPTVHIGKSSYGWKFSLHIIPEKNILSLEDWKREWSKEGTTIKDEYDRTFTPQEMLEVITNRGDGRYCPKGKQLSDHNVDGIHCAGSGEGTWDYILGDFS